jgi:hypothetical protein
MHANRNRNRNRNKQINEERRGEVSFSLDDGQNATRKQGSL